MLRSRFKYLFPGGFAGWFAGYTLCLASNGWYFARLIDIFEYSLLGAIFGALLYNGLMMVEGYSNKLRFGATGMLFGLALACIGGMIYVKNYDLMRFSFQDGLFFDWALIHCAIIIGIIGFLIGSRADRRLSHS
jgi:hypothetical protein